MVLACAELMEPAGPQREALLREQVEVEEAFTPEKAVAMAKSRLGVTFVGVGATENGFNAKHDCICRFAPGDVGEAGAWKVRLRHGAGKRLISSVASFAVSP